MMLKKTFIAVGMLLGAGVAFAAPNQATTNTTNNMTANSSMAMNQAAHPAQELAANVVSIKQPIIDNQVTRNNATEVFMELINNGTEPHELIAATSPVASQVQLHATVMEHGQSTMEQVNGLTIKTHAEEDLQLGGLHVMLMGLKKPLVKNSIVPITLIFNDGSWKTINAKVS